MKKTRILASAVNYNSNEDICKLIENLIDIEERCGWVAIDILIIDNSPRDQKKLNFCRKLIADYGAVDTTSEFRGSDKIIYIDNENNGFGEGHNIALDLMEECCKFEALWILNTDLYLTDSTLNEMREILFNESVSIIGSAIREVIDSKLQINYGTSDMKTFRGYGPVRYNGTKLMKVDGVIGASMVIKRNVAEAKVRFDPRYFMYVEESDFCLNAARMGFESYVATQSIVDHVGGKTFGECQALRWYYKVRNLLYFKKKNYESNNFLLIVYLLISTIRQFGFSKDYLASYFRGVLHYEKNIMGKILNG